MIGQPPHIFETVILTGPDLRRAAILNSSGADVELYTAGERPSDEHRWSFAYEVDAYRAILAWLYTGELPVGEGVV